MLMNTENKFYKQFGIVSVSDTQLILNHTDKRNSIIIKTFRIMFLSLLVIEVLSYNRMEIYEFVFTSVLVFLSFLYLKFETKIWYKQIVFNKVKQEILYKRNFPKENLRFRYNSVSFDTEIKKIVKYKYVKLYLTDGLFT